MPQVTERIGLCLDKKVADDVVKVNHHHPRPVDGDCLGRGEDDLGLADHRGHERGVAGVGHVAVLPLLEVVHEARHVGRFALEERLLQATH